MADSQQVPPGATHSGNLPLVLEAADLIERWRAAAGQASPPVAAAYRRCADDLDRWRREEGDHPIGLVPVARIHGLTSIVEIVQAPSGRYGLVRFSAVPGQQDLIRLPDGRQLRAPNNVITPSLTWFDALWRAAQLTDDRQEAGGSIPAGWPAAPAASSPDPL